MSILTPLSNKNGFDQFEYHPWGLCVPMSFTEKFHEQSISAILTRGMKGGSERGWGQSDTLRVSPMTMYKSPCSILYSKVMVKGVADHKPTITQPNLTS